MGNEALASAVNEPRFSVVCPAYNSQAYILRTLQTVVDQQFGPLELIIIDDGSSDGTPELVEAFLAEHARRFEWSVLRTSHRGPGAARNAGVQAASGEWIAFLDSDDIWFPHKLARVRDVITSDSRVNFICHHEELIKLDGSVVGLDYSSYYTPDRPLPLQMYQRNLFSTSAVACRRDLLVRNGMFDETLMSAQDYELWLRLAPQIVVRFIQERLGQYVERQGNITSGNWRRRMHNELRIAFLHRRQVSFPAFMLRASRVLYAYSRIAARQTLARFRPAKSQ